MFAYVGLIHNLKDLKGQVMGLAAEPPVKVMGLATNESHHGTSKFHQFLLASPE